MSGIIIAIVVFIFLLTCCIYAICIRHRQHTSLVKEYHENTPERNASAEQNSLFDVMSLQDIYHSKSYSSASSSRLSGDSSSFTESFEGEREREGEEEESEGQGEEMTQTDSQGTHRLSKKSSSSFRHPLRFHPFTRRMSSDGGTAATRRPASLGITVWDDDLHQFEEHQLPQLNKDLDIFTFPNMYASSSEEDNTSHLEAVNLDITLASSDDEEDHAAHHDLPLVVTTATSPGAEGEEEDEEKSSLPYTPTSLRSVGSSHGSGGGSRKVTTASVHSKDSKNSNRSNKFQFLRTRSSSRDVIVSTDPHEL
jgi:hypothetical protein